MTDLSLSPARYSRVAIILHWLMAVLIIGQLVGGKVMVGMAATTLKFDLYQWHKAFGLTILVLALVRLAWRLSHRPPALSDGVLATLKPWERAAAGLTHIGFYGFMIGVPLLGWAMVSASEKSLPTSWFGLFTVPHLPIEASQDTAKLMAQLHEITAIATALLLVLHVGAAVKHHFILRDGVLARMAPWVKSRG